MEDDFGDICYICCVSGIGSFPVVDREKGLPLKTGMVSRAFLAVSALNLSGGFSGFGRRKSSKACNGLGKVKVVELFGYMYDDEGEDYTVMEGSAEA